MSRALRAAVLIIVSTGVSFNQSRSAAPAAASPFWGDLEPGPYGSVLRLVTFDDASRPYAPDVPRRIRAVVTSPASAGPSRWSFLDLLRAVCGDNRAAVVDSPDRCVGQQLKDLSEYRPDAGRPFERASLNAPLYSARAATPVDGRFPVVIFDGGLTSDALSYVVLAEYLTSHGFVTVSLPSVPFAADRALTFDVDGVTSKAADIAVAIAGLTRLQEADPERLALAAWSVGGVSTTLAQMRERRVRAIVSLDGGMGYDYGPPLAAASPLFDQAAARVPAIHLTGLAPNRFPVPKSTAFFESARPGPSILAGIPDANHAQFIMTGGPLAFVGETSSAARAFWRAHGSIATIVRAFLQATTAGAEPASLVEHLRRALPPGSDVTLRDLKASRVRLLSSDFRLLSSHF